MSTEIETVVGIIKAVPGIIDVSKNIWKKLTPPDKLPEGKVADGIFDKSFYSERYKFSISVPDDNWRYWQPSPQFLAGMGPALSIPTRDMPIVILSKQMINLFRSNVSIMIEDVGSFTNINEVTDFTKQSSLDQGLEINGDDIHISPNSNSAVLVLT